MTDNATRKSFWKRNGLKFPGSVRIVPSNSRSSSGQTDNETINQEPIVIGARYNYTSLVTARHNLSTDTSTPPPLLPSHYPSGKSSAFSALIPNHKNNNATSLSSTKKPTQHKHTVSSTKKSFNAFLEDTNDEWNDSMEDDSHITIITPASNINTDKEPINKKDNNNNNNSNNNNNNSNNNNSSNNNDNNKNNLSPTATTTTNSGSKDKNINTIDHSNLPQINKQNYTSTVINKDNLLTENNNNITNTNNHDNNASKSIDPSSILQQQQQQQKPAASKNAKGVVYNIKDVLQDPTHTLWHIEPERMADPGKSKKFKEILTSANVDLVSLRSICWSGIPMQFRLMAWQLLLGYLPCNSERREETLARKRKEYSDSVKASYSRGNSGLDQSLYHQIHIDILRTNPGVPLYQSTTTQGCLERILYQWAIRHPASGYVQGINDLVTPIFEVFLSAYIDSDPENYDVNSLNQEILDVIEADSFWCLSKLLDGIQDNYTFAQPGIQRQIVTLKDLVSRIDAQLANHLQQEGVEFIQFAFRWMNCLLMRELPLKNTIRMWDTYLAEGSSEGFSEFHVYVCAAFLVKWSTQLQKMDFQEIMIFLQQLPTSGWQEKDIELLLSEAYMWKTLFHNAPNHLKNK